MSRDPLDAAVHTRRREHYMVPRRAPGQLFHLVADAVGEPPLPRVEGEPYATLWRLGMHPALVDEVRRRVCARDSLPAEFYLEVMGARREVVWLGQALWRLRPSDEDAVWMARHGREPEKDDDGPEAA